MQWIKPKLQYDVEMESKAHDYAVFVGGKVVILDFTKMNRERKLDYLRFDGKKIKNLLKGNTRIWTGDLQDCSLLLYHWAILP